MHRCSRRGQWDGKELTLGTSSMDSSNEPDRDGGGGLIFMLVGKHSGIKDPGSPRTENILAINGT